MNVEIKRFFVMCVGVLVVRKLEGEFHFLLTLRDAIKSVIAFVALFGNFSLSFSLNHNWLREVALSLLSMSCVIVEPSPESLSKERSQ
jgi:hypothetical protein